MNLLGVLLLLASLVGGARVDAHPSLANTERRIDAQIEADPTDADLYLLRASVHRSEGLLAEALSDLARAAALEPGRSDVARVRGLVLLESGRAAEAEPILGELARQSPTDPERRLAHARALAALGRDAEAAGELSVAIAGVPRASPELYLERARSLARAHAPDPDPALASLEEARRALGVVVALEEFALELELNAGRPGPAIARLERLASLGQRKEHWWVREGEILAAAGRTAEARETLGRALDALARRARFRRETVASRELEERARALLGSLAGDGD